MSHKARRITQHRVEREAAHAKELAEARRLISQLTRRVSRLQRQLEKRGFLAKEAEVAAQEDSSVPRPAVEICSSCGGKHIVIFDTPSGKRIRACSTCKARVVIEKKDAL